MRMIENIFIGDVLAESTMISTFNKHSAMLMAYNLVAKKSSQAHWQLDTIQSNRRLQRRLRSGARVHLLKFVDVMTKAQNEAEHR